MLLPHITNIKNILETFYILFLVFNICYPCVGFPGGPVVKKKKKNLPANAGNARDRGAISGLVSFPRGGNNNSFQYSCLENPVNRGAWLTVHGVAKESEMTD